MSDILNYFEKPVFSSTDENGENLQYLYEGTNKKVPSVEVEKASFLAAKSEAKSLIDAWRAQQENSGIFEAALPSVGKHKFQYSAKAKTDILGLVVAVQGEMIEGVIWTDADNQDLNLSAQDIVALSGYFLTFTQEVHETSRAAKVAIEGAISIEELNQILKPFNLEVVDEAIF